jgi:hypothetical protein
MLSLACQLTVFYQAAIRENAAGGPNRGKGAQPQKGGAAPKAAFTAVDCDAQRSKYTFRVSSYSVWKLTSIQLNVKLHKKQHLSRHSILRTWDQTPPSQTLISFAWHERDGPALSHRIFLKLAFSEQYLSETIPLFWCIALSGI